MERGCTGYYRLLLVRSLLATSLVSPPACAHARSLLSPAVCSSFVFKSPSCQHLITLRLYLINSFYVILLDFVDWIVPIGTDTLYSLQVCA